MKIALVVNAEASRDVLLELQRRVGQAFFKAKAVFPEPQGLLSVTFVGPHQCRNMLYYARCGGGITLILLQRLVNGHGRQQGSCAAFFGWSRSSYDHKDSSNTSILDSLSMPPKETTKQTDVLLEKHNGPWELQKDAYREVVGDGLTFRSSTLSRSCITPRQNTPYHTETPIGEDLLIMGRDYQAGFPPSYND